MKKILLGIIIISLFSCDKREDFLSGLNEAPVLLIDSKDNPGTNTPTPTTSVIDSFKLSLVPYRLNVASSDDSQNSSLTAFISPSESFDFIQNSPVINGTKEEINGIVYFNPSTAGTYIINVVAQDKFAVTTTVEAKVVIFNNKPPIIPNIIVTSDPIVDPKEYNLDASSAFDQDNKYGGSIVKYNWVITGSTYTYDVETEFSIIQHIFPVAGTYQIKARCLDNDGDWSTFKIVSQVVS